MSAYSAEELKIYLSTITDIDLWDDNNEHIVTECPRALASNTTITAIKFPFKEHQW